MPKKKVYIIITLVFILAFISGNLVFPQFLKLPRFPNIPFKLGLDLQGGTHLVYEADISQIDKTNVNEAMQGVRDVIERRVNAFGITEPLVQIDTVGEHHRLIVELAGIKDINQAIKMIGETPYLEFLEQRTPEETKQILDKINDLQGKTLEEMQKVEDWQLAFQNPYFKPTGLTGKYLSRASISLDQTTYKPEIQLQFDSEGAKLFEEITGRNIKKPLAIFLDGASIVDTNGDGKIDTSDLYAPIVQEKITGGKAQITGNLTEKEANLLVRRLNAGALPLPIKLINQESVGASLGETSLGASLIAGLIGLAAVALFMILWYRLPGLVAVIALLIYTAVVLAIFKLLPVTLTLSGIAGFILSIGMAVDANILIFERTKEELRWGKSLGEAVNEGFKRAWTSIRDSNVSSLITCIILFWLGTSIIKGFAFTLAIGILVSMFSAITVTRIFLKAVMVEKLANYSWLFGGKKL